MDNSAGFCVKRPNIWCTQREECLENKYRWLNCELRKEFIIEQVDKHLKIIEGKQYAAKSK